MFFAATDSGFVIQHVPRYLSYNGCEFSLGGPMRFLLALAVVALLIPPVFANQDAKTEELLKKIDQALESEREKLRTELLDIVRQELKGTGAAPKPKATERVE